MTGINAGRIAALETVPAPAPPPRARGVIALLEENCTVCMLCVRDCPDWCIEIEAHQESAPAEGGGRPRIHNVLDAFRIDFGLCMYCGICIEVCPFDALFWAPDYAYPATTPDGLVHDRERLRSWLPSVPPPEPLDAGPVPDRLSGSRIPSASPAKPAR